MEAIRQMRREVGEDNVMYIHCTLVPLLHAAHEMKTKPTQHSVAELRSIGIQPNMLVLRAEQPIDQEHKDKISDFTDVPVDRIIESIDAPSLFDVPLEFQKQGMDQKVCDFLHLESPKPEADMEAWKKLDERAKNLEHKTKITLVGKYVELEDAYISVTDALQHAGYLYNTKIEVDKVQAEDITEDNIAEIMKDSDGLIVPGGFGTRGLEGMITAIKYARENDIPFLGICLGMQMASVEFARNVLNLEDANSAEVNQTARTTLLISWLISVMKKILVVLYVWVFIQQHLRKVLRLAKLTIIKMLSKNVTVTVSNLTINIVKLLKRLVWSSQVYLQIIA